MNGRMDGKMERGREINEEIISGWRGGRKCGCTDKGINEEEWMDGEYMAG